MKNIRFSVELFRVLVVKIIHKITFLQRFNIYPFQSLSNQEFDIHFIIVRMISLYYDRNFLSYFTYI